MLAFSFSLCKVQGYAQKCIHYTRLRISLFRCLKNMVLKKLRIYSPDIVPRGATCIFASGRIGLWGSPDFLKNTVRNTAFWKKIGKKDKKVIFNWKSVKGMSSNLLSWIGFVTCVKFPEASYGWIPLPHPSVAPLLVPKLFPFFALFSDRINGLFWRGI